MCGLTAYASIVRSCSDKVVHELECYSKDAQNVLLRLLNRIKSGHAMCNAINLELGGLTESIQP